MQTVRCAFPGRLRTRPSRAANDLPGVRSLERICPFPRSSGPTVKSGSVFPMERCPGRSLCKVPRVIPTVSFLVFPKCRAASGSSTGEAIRLPIPWNCPASKRAVPTSSSSAFRSRSNRRTRPSYAASRWSLLPFPSSSAVRLSTASGTWVQARTRKSTSPGLSSAIRWRPGSIRTGSGCPRLRCPGDCLDWG